MLKQLLHIIPKEKHKPFIRFFIKSMMLNLLDLVSIAYLIPIIVLLLDKEKFYQILEHIGINNISISDSFLIVMIALLLLFYLIKNMIQTRFNKFFFNFLYDLSNTISIRTLKAFIQQDFLKYQNHDKGYFINMIMKVVGDFCSKLLHSIILLCSEIILLLIVTCFLVYFYPKFTIITLLILGVFSVVIYYKKKADFETINTTYNESQSSANSKLINIIDAFLEIRSSGNEDYFIDSFEKENQQLNHVTALLVSSSFNYSKYLEITLIFCIGVLAYFSLASDHSNIILLSTLAALGFKLIPSLSKILNGITHVKSHFYTIKMLTQINSIANPRSFHPDASTFSEITMHNVSFAYASNQPILDDINFQIKPGEFIGIMGISGIGKTTFLYLIMGLLQPVQGSIRIDKNQVSNGGFLPFISYVPQQPFLLSGSLLENITMGQYKEEIDYDYIHFLLDKLKLTSLIDKLPDGLQTQIQHDSLRFSGGQKQRISIARALYTKPKLLILDEATNQQNSQLEFHIFEFLQELKTHHNISILSVSHNHKLAHFYDRTYEIINKKVTQIGV